MSELGKRRKAYRRGHSAEHLAALALILKGYRIVGRRYRTKLGEIDLIARRGDTVLIVEVKARATLEQAMDSVNALTMRRIEAAADHWLARQVTIPVSPCALISSLSCPGAGPCMCRRFLPSRQNLH